MLSMRSVVQKSLLKTPYSRSFSATSNFVVLGDDSAFNKIAESKTKKILYFTATWCPPCKAIAPIFETLSKKHPDLSFVKIDVDSLTETAQKYKIRSVPTFIFMNGQTQLAQVRCYALNACLSSYLYTHSAIYMYVYSLLGRHKQT